MKNVKLTVSNNKLTIEIDLSRDFGESSSGKSLIIATSEGNQSIPGAEGCKIGLNVYKPTRLGNRHGE